MMSEAAPSQPPVDSSQKQTKTTTSSAGIGAETPPQQAAVTTSLTSDNPPAYSASDASKEQEAQLNQPPLVYLPTVGKGGGQVPSIQYAMAAPIQQTIPKPSYPGPHDFLLFIVISVIVCAIFNLTSIGFGIPALVLALLARSFRDSQRDYPKASKYSTYAIALTITTITYTLCVALVIVFVEVTFDPRLGRIVSCNRLVYSTSNRVYDCRG